MLNLTINRHLPAIRAAQRVGMGCATRYDHKLLTVGSPPGAAPAKTAKPKRRGEPCYLRILRTN